MDPAAQVGECITGVEVAGDDLEGGKGGRRSMQTLKHIVVNIYVDDEDDDSLFGILT